MSGFFASDTFETLMGGLILLFVLALAIKMGPLRFIGEMLAHLAFKIVFLVVAIGVLFVFIDTEISQSLGGIDTALYLIFGAPFVLIVIGIVQAWRKPKPEDDDDNR